MKLKSTFASLMAALALGGAIATPMSAGGQDWLEKEFKRRQSKKNEWRNIGIGSGALGLYGLLKGDNTLFFAGAAGALYSSWRYEQDRKSQSKVNRARAAAFSKPYFYRDGKKYVRKTVWQDGKKHYRFVRA